MVSLGPELVLIAAIALIAIYAIIQIIQFFVGVVIKIALIFVILSGVWFALHMLGFVAEPIPPIPLALFA